MITYTIRYHKELDAWRGIVRCLTDDHRRFLWQKETGINRIDMGDALEDAQLLADDYKRINNLTH